MNASLKIVTVYTESPRREDRMARDLVPTDMSYIRWYRISQALAEAGHDVDMAVPAGLADRLDNFQRRLAPSVGRVELPQIRWSDYDVVKTVFHLGLQTLENFGGDTHSFIISKLGSVVGATDLPGIYFYGEIRRQLFEMQKRVADKSRYVTLLSSQGRRLWRDCYGRADNVLLVPGAADSEIPGPVANPFVSGDRRVALFAGNIYTQDSQPEANQVLVDKLNRLGRLLRQRDFQLFFLGTGDTGNLDRDDVKQLGAVAYDETWNYYHHADVGVVVSAGDFMHNNESSKIYHYLRAGLPVINESGFPNDHIVAESGLGLTVKSGDLEAMAEAVMEAANLNQAQRAHAQNYILKYHTWKQRVEVYTKLFQREFASASEVID